MKNVWQTGWKSEYFYNNDLNFFIKFYLLFNEIPRSPTCPNCAKNSQPTKKVYLDFDNKDCSQCQQYAMLIDIKETQIDTLKSNTQSITDMKKEMTKNQLKYDELMTKIANTNKMLMQKENELLKCQQTIESLKRELSALQINDTENVAPNKADLLLHEKSGEVIQALAPIIQQK